MKSVRRCFRTLVVLGAAADTLIRRTSSLSRFLSLMYLMPYYLVRKSLAVQKVVLLLFFTHSLTHSLSATLTLSSPADSA